jgi:hypothetical protein
MKKKCTNKELIKQIVEVFVEDCNNDSDGWSAIAKLICEREADMEKRYLQRNFLDCDSRVTFALAAQKAELKKKVLEIISSTCIGDDVAHHFRARIKKRISEAV